MRAGDAKMTALHDAAVKQGAMQQLLVWIGFFELFGFVAIVQMLQGGDRQPGDFGFDPLNCAKDPNVSVNPLQSLSIAPLFVDNPAKPSLWRPLTGTDTLARALICLGRVPMPARIPARILDAKGSLTVSNMSIRHTRRQQIACVNPALLPCRATPIWQRVRMRVCWVRTVWNRSWAVSKAGDASGHGLAFF